MTPLRVSARTLAEYTYFAVDLSQMSMQAMVMGRLGHRARQKESSAQAERAISWKGECAGLSFHVTGRIDLLDDSVSPPVVEEIKVTSGEEPICALPAHRAQALCYGFMLAQKNDLEGAALRIHYVREDGTTLASFLENLSFGELADGFFALLEPYAMFMAQVLAYRQRRDDSLASLDFPYADFRPGQRDMAAQVFTAIKLKKRLFAVMPTGTGKSAATLYPALKALGQGLTAKILFLTARTTGREAALKEARGMTARGARARFCVITAKEKCCPREVMDCDPDVCPRAKGFYGRLKSALEEAFFDTVWDAGYIADLADKHTLCPFELSLELCLHADVIIGDYNYAFDPIVYLQRIFDRTRDITLLIDEAHNVPGRVRDMLSAELSGPDAAAWRRDLGKRYGRGAPLYKALSELITALRNLPEHIDFLPEAFAEALDRALDLSRDMALPGTAGRELHRFCVMAGRYVSAPEDYAAIIRVHGKEKSLMLLCLNITDYLGHQTAKLRGCVYFSATLSPLLEMRRLLGGTEEDACFSLPSPFPPENLLVMTLPVNTRYSVREQTAAQIAQAVADMYRAHPGKYITYFPSYAYLDKVSQFLEGMEDIPLHVQQKRMGDVEREHYLRRFSDDERPFLGLCVLGGVFAEGIDLPGRFLIGVCIVGVGLPQVNRVQEYLRASYQKRLGNGFDHAYRFPGMQKVLQASGRVIRSEEDRGVILLLDDRYAQDAYRCLLPENYYVRTLKQSAGITQNMQEFWGR